MATPTGEKKRKPKPTPGNIAYAILLLLLLALLLYLAFVRITGGIPSFFGYSVVRIVTPSMEPKIPVGSFVLIKNVTPDEVSEGDIITFYTDDPDPAVAGKTITHRVLSIDAGEDGKYVFETKGDNLKTNPVPDAYPARGERLVGRYVCDLLPITAFAALFRSHLPVAIILILLIPAMILIRKSVKNILKKTPAEREEYIRRRVEEELARIKGVGAPDENSDRPDDGTNQPKPQAERKNDDV